MRWTNTWYSETGISFGGKGPIDLNTDFTFLTFTKFFLQSSRGSERFSHFFYWHKILFDATVGIVLEIMVRMYDTTVENYNFNLEKNLIHQVFFCLCLNVIWLKLHPVNFFFRICLEEWLWYCPCVTKSSPSSACAVSYAALSSKVIIMFDE